MSKSDRAEFHQIIRNYGRWIEMQWQQIANPNHYVTTICMHEAPDVPQSLLAGEWHQCSLYIKDIQCDNLLLARHDADTLHNKRRDRFIQLIQSGALLPPLIVLHCQRGEYYLIDGYARLRALLLLNIEHIQVLAKRSDA